MTVNGQLVSGNRYMVREMRHDVLMAQWSPCNATASTSWPAPFVAWSTGINMAEAESRRHHDTATRQGPAEIAFEFEPTPLEISPALAMGLLRILRKAAERRHIEIDGTVSPPS